jgi:HD-GYP domain-containing protein (c-di-GMP phosphodiesterase class II)
MKNEFDFFTIERSHLMGKRFFPFQLYIFNPIQKHYSLFLNGNRPLTSELEQLLDELIEKGAQISILKKQRRTFLMAQELKESDIPSLASRVLHESEKEQIMNINLKLIYDTNNGVFNFRDEFEKACESDNFEKIIEYARMEIITFNVTQSTTVSIAIKLAKLHLSKDNYINRIVCVSYFFAKMANILEPDSLADIVCGAFFSHLGLTQLPLKLIRTPLLSLNSKDKKLFEKHTILSQHLINKGRLEISERCKRIILDHHERVSGEGYPSMKSAQSIEHLSLIVGGIAYLFEFSTGRINGSKIPIKNILMRMKNKSFSQGMEFDFGEEIFNNLISLINTEKEVKAAA